MTRRGVNRSEPFARECQEVWRCEAGADGEGGGVRLVEAVVVVALGRLDVHHLVVALHGLRHDRKALRRTRAHSRKALRRTRAHSRKALRKDTGP